MPVSSTQPKVIKDQFGNLVLAPTGMPTGNGQLSQVGNSATSPEAAAAGGANPDAAKMAGTPNQTSAPTILPQSPAPNAVRQAQSPQGQTLREAVRVDQQPSSQMTETQAKQAQEAQRFQQQFGDLGSRVQNLIASAIAPPSAAATQTTGVSTLDAGAQSAVQAYAANPNVETYAAAKQALGGGDPNQYIPASDSTAIAKQMAEATPDQIRMTPEVLGQLGYDAATIGEVLGIDPSQLDGMTLQQFQQQIDSQMQRDFSTVAALRAQIDDPAMGPNERAQARAQLAQMGASGVYATEQDMGALRQSVDDADTVEFNGATYTVEELLTDDTISGVITNYLDDPKFAAKLREREPQFAAYLDQHAAALRELAIHTGDAAKQFDEISTSNAALKSKLGTAGLDQSAIEALLDAVSPGSSSEYSTSKIDFSGYPALQQLISGANPSLAKAFADAGSISPEVVRDLASKAPGQLAKIGAGGTGPEDAAKFRNYLNYHADLQALDALDTHDPRAIALYLFGDPDTSLKEQLGQFRKPGTHSLAHSTAMQRALDSKPKDGKPDTPEQIAKNIRALLGPQDPAKLSDALAPNIVRLLRGGPAAFRAETARLTPKRPVTSAPPSAPTVAPALPLPPEVAAETPAGGGGGPSVPVPFQNNGKNGASPDNGGRVVETVTESITDPGEFVSKTLPKKPKW